MDIKLVESQLAEARLEINRLDRQVVSLTNERDLFKSQLFRVNAELTDIKKLTERQLRSVLQRFEEVLQQDMKRAEKRLSELKEISKNKGIENDHSF